jgi:hypothetical protein
VAAGVLTQLKGSKGDTVLLVGPCGAGKTTLLLQVWMQRSHPSHACSWDVHPALKTCIAAAQLEEGEVKNGTVASMEENISMVAPSAGKVLPQSVTMPCTSEGSRQHHANNPSCWLQEGSARVVRVVDVPGHARIAHRIFSEHVKRARGIVFLVDSVDFMGQKVGRPAPCTPVLRNSMEWLWWMLGRAAAEQDSQCCKGWHLSSCGSAKPHPTQPSCMGPRFMQCQ